MIKIKFPSEQIADLSALSSHISAIQGDIEVAIESGEYYGCLTLNNLACSSLKLCGSNATISGAKYYNFTFEKDSLNRLVANIGADRKVEGLIINGKRLWPAGYPKFDSGNVAKCYDNLDNINKRAVNWSNIDCAKLHSLHTHEWGGNNYNIIGYENGKLITQWVGNNNRGDGYLASKCRVENILEELTTANEFYYDSRLGLLYISQEYSDANNTDVGIISQDTLLQISDNRANIEIVGINFKHTPSNMYKGVWERYLRSDWAYNKLSAINITNSENVSLSNCTFKDIGGNCLGIFGYDKDITVNKCKFAKCLSNGVLILGDKDSTYCTSSWEGNNHIEFMESDGERGAKTNNYPRNIMIMDSYFHDLGIIDKQSAGICVSLSHKVTIDACTIHSMPRAGVNIAENAFGGHVISRCDIYDCVKETGDHGPFNSWGRDRFWSLGGYNTTGKLGALKVKYYQDDMLGKIQLVNNRIMGSHGFGIDLDDGSSNYEIMGNICIGKGIKLREGFNRLVKDNVLIGAPFDLHATYVENGDVIVGNIVYCKDPIRAVIQNRGYNTIIKNNRFVNCNKRWQKNSMLRNGNNKFEIKDINLNNVAKLHGDDYGSSLAKPPHITICGDDSVKKIWNVYGKFSSIDEGCRSMAGAESYDGVFVLSILPFNILWRLGVRKGDVIIALDNIKIIGSAVDWRSVAKCKSVLVMRNQLQVKLGK